jgi:hypothetical protein
VGFGSLSLIRGEEFDRRVHGDLLRQHEEIFVTRDEQGSRRAGECDEVVVFWVRRRDR